MTTTTAGTVRSWNADEGWGVVDLDPVVGGDPGLPAVVRDVWVHFGAVVGRDFGYLVPGERVSVTWDEVPHPPHGGQASAVVVADGGSGGGPIEASGSGVMNSTLTVRWDDRPGGTTDPVG
jgi:cold shock CspA family protein